MKKLILSVLFIASAPLTLLQAIPLSCDLHTLARAQTPAELLNQWLEEYVDNLNAQELQLLANVLQAGYSYMSLDSYLRRCGQMLLAASGALRIDIIKAQPEHATFKKFQKLLTVIDPLLQRHHEQALIWEHINNLLEQPGYENVANTVGGLQEVIQKILQLKLAAMGADLDATLVQAQKASSEAAQALHFASQTYQSLINNEFPTDKSLEQDPRMMKIAVACNIINGLQKHLDTNTQTNMATVAHAEALQETGVVIFANCYQAIYETLISNEDASLAIMVNEDGLIPAQERTFLLPTPEQLLRGEC